MAFLDGTVPPGVYTETFFGTEEVPPSLPDRVPLYIGTGQELLTRSNLAIVRGSSSTVDTLVTEEDVAGRAVVSVNPDGSVTLGDFDGELTRFQVRNFPLVNGDGSALPATDTSSVTVTLNDEPIVVLSLDAAKGIVEMAAAPSSSDVVRCTYYFDRSDTRTTDDVSAQVTPTAAILDGSIGQSFAFTAGFNDNFLVSVDGGTFVSITLPSTAPSFTAAVVAATINGTPGIGSLVASTFVDNFGRTCIRLTADESLTIGTGSANTVLGFVPGTTTTRNRVFTVFNGPIVTGNGGGVTTTNPSDVVVKVNGVTVTASSVDGATRRVTLPTAPPVDATVTIQYWWNTWQDTFDYLANTGVTAINTVGITPDSSLAGTYLNGVSYVLKDDRILWGSAALVSAGVHTTGGATFGSNQVSASLVDNQVFMSPCAPTVDTSTSVAVASKTVFQLEHQPTTGNGRGNPLGSTLYNQVSNGRMDLPTTQPSLVTAYWGYGVLDALARGPVTVVSVNPDLSQITLASAVPDGATVYASYYYNTLVDQAFIGSSSGYTLSCVTPGAGGIGTYRVTNGLGDALYGVSMSGKGSALTTIQVVFPSGSEFFPDARIEGGTPVEETVTVQFATSDATPAVYVNPGPSPYYFVDNLSDHLRVTIDGSDQQTGLAAGIDLASPTGGSRIGAFASLVGEPVVYTPESGETTYTITTGVDDVISLSVDGVVISGAAAPGATQDIDDYVTAINTASVGVGNEPFYVSAGSFPNGYTVATGAGDTLALHYTGSLTGVSGLQSIVLAPGTYASVGALVTQINTQLATINAGGGLDGTVTCSATADAKLKFSLTLSGFDTSGVLEFLTWTTPAEDFAVVAGIDTASGAQGTQTKVYSGPIARRYTVATTGGRLPYDRIILRNRLFPGFGSVYSQAALELTGLRSLGGTGAEKAGLPTGVYGEASVGVVQSPTLLGVVGWSGGQVGAQPKVTFYDGTDPLYPANNVLSLTVNGRPLTVTFTASSTGTDTALGPAGTSGTVLRQIGVAMISQSVNTILTVIQEGAGIRFVAANSSPTSSLVMGRGSANDVLGFTADAVSSSTPVTAHQLASTLMSHAQSSFTSFMFSYGAESSAYFAGRAIASTVIDSTNNTYLRIQSLTLGTSSSILFKTPTSADALATGTMFLAAAGNGASGRAAINGFFVTSSDPTNGSGSANTSILNSGVGQDGFVGQTYVDDVTGLTFTILPRNGGLSYPTGSTATVSFSCSRTVSTNGNVPSLVIPGVELLVTNTGSVVPGDTALVETFKKTGPEPAIGEFYYATYTYRKRGFTPRFWTRLQDVVAEYGPVSPDNPLSLAAFVAFLNGSSVIATLQVPKQSGSSAASESSYLDALKAAEGNSLPGNNSPTVLVLLTPATQNLAIAVARHCDVQSSIRYRSERTAIFGFGSGTSPRQAGVIARATGSTRVRFVYPDIASMRLTDALGVSRTYLVDGRYPAAALAAATTSTVRDPAAPWEGVSLVGFTSLGRRLDAVTANQVANNGITVLTENLPYLSVRHGLTSDMTNVLTRIPTVIQIDDEIHRRVRNVLSGFVGIKFLAGVLGQIEGQMSEMFKRAVSEQIISSFRGVTASLDPDDPTAVLVSAAYRPVFPLLYIRVTFRVSVQ